MTTRQLPQLSHDSSYSIDGAFLVIGAIMQAITQALKWSGGAPQ